MMSTALATETAQQESEAIREEREEVRLLNCVVCSSFISLESCCRSHPGFRKYFTSTRTRNLAKQYCSDWLLILGMLEKVDSFHDLIGKLTFIHVPVTHLQNSFSV